MSNCLKLVYANRCRIVFNVSLWLHFFSCCFASFLHTVIWYQVFFFKTNYLNTVVWFKVIQFNPNNYMVSSNHIYLIFVICLHITLTKRLEKKLDGNYTRMLRAILNKSWRATPHKTPTVQSPNSYHENYSS